MRFEITKPGWGNSRYRIERSLRQLRGKESRTGTLTAHCGRNLDEGSDNPTNRCLRLDKSGLEARIHTLVDDKVITLQQAQEWIQIIPTTIDDRTIRGSCLESAMTERPHVYDYFHHERRRCGGVMVTKHPL